MAHESTVVIKSLQEGLGGIRDILIDGTQEVYCDIYRKSESTLRRTQSKSQFIGGSPRYMLEALGIVVITAVAYVLAQENEGVIKAIPLLGGLAMAAQRLLPLSQQAYQSWSNIQSSQASLEEALNFLDQPLPRYLGSGDVTHLSFCNEIKLNHIFFRYDHTGPWIFENLSLTIAKGSRIGFIGATGAGNGGTVLSHDNSEQHPQSVSHLVLLCVHAHHRFRCHNFDNIFLALTCRALIHYRSLSLFSSLSFYLKIYLCLPVASNL
jgi:ATP-binding cassette subfamily B protein